MPHAIFYSMLHSHSERLQAELVTIRELKQFVNREWDSSWTVPEIAQALLPEIQMLPQIVLGSQNDPPREILSTRQRSIQNCGRAFLCGVAFAKKNQQRLWHNIFLPLQNYHSAAGITLSDLRQMSVEILLQPQSFLQKFQHSSQEPDWYPKLTDYICNRLELALLDRLRASGIADFRRTNLGLVNRASYKLVKEIFGAPDHQALHRCLKEAVAAKEFNTFQPGYLALWQRYRQHVPTATSETMIQQLQELGHGIRSATRPAFYSIDSLLTTDSSPWLRAESSNPLEAAIGQWDRQQARDLVRNLQQYIGQLQPPDREIVDYTLQGLKDWEIADRLGCNGSTIGRRRKRIFYGFLYQINPTLALTIKTGSPEFKQLSTLIVAVLSSQVA
jgi:DNA-binding CsgD family transcriptional regulator